MRMHHIAGVGIMVLALAACATDPKPLTVNMPTASSCIPKALPPAPVGLESRESLAAAPEAGERYKRLYADWKVRVARMLETEPVIASCR